MIKPEDFTGTNYLVIEGIVDKGDKISIKYRDKYCKTIKTLVIKFDKEGYYTFDRGSIHIRCSRETLAEEINKQTFSSFVSNYEGLKTDKVREKRKTRGIKIKNLLKDTLKSGDIVERYGKTPNLGLYLIEVDKISDYGVSGFYLFNNRKRSNEYTTVLWDYIKGKEVSNMGCKSKKGRK